MATVSTPARQPFGVLGESKLRNLQSIKNRQNGELSRGNHIKAVPNSLAAITPSSTSSLKRRAASPELSDSENIDPSYFDTSIKRKRAAIEDDVSLAKQPRFTTKIVPSTTTSTKSSAPVFTPRLDTLSKSSTTPFSAPAAAGRSPTKTSSRAKLDRSVPRRRFVPPSIGASPSLSIAAAFRGTIAHKKSRSKRTTTLENTKPKSWFFDIYEESEAQQDYNVKEWSMTQSSANLDLSGDEKEMCSSKHAGEDRGKENVDPTGAPAPVPVSRSPVLEVQDENAMVAEEPRTPLGDLNASEFYGEGLDATSVVLVHDDVPAEEVETEQQPEAEVEVCSAPIAEDFTFQAPAFDLKVAARDIPEWAKTTSLTLETPQVEEQADDAMPMGVGGDIDIWESESAKDENEPLAQEDQEQQSSFFVVGEGQTVSLSRSCLQEV